MKVHIALIVVMLVLSAGCLEEDSEEKNKNPTAKIYVGQSTFNLGDTVTIEGTDSEDSDGKIVQYMFWYGDGDNSGVLDTGFDTHVYTEPGEITITLVVWDDDGAVGTATTGTIKINEPPVANMSIKDGGGVPTNEAWVGEQLFFDSSSSYDNDGAILPASTEWEFGDGSTATGPDVTHTFLANGTYKVNLTVEDTDEATTTVSQNVVVTMQRFKATWNNTGYEEIENTEIYLEDNGTDEYNNIVLNTNVTQVWVNLSWTDDEILLSQPDQFTLGVDNPFDQIDHTVTGQEGTLSFMWDRAYPTLNFWAPSIADAQDFAADKNMTNMKWSSNYNITIGLITDAVILDPGNLYRIEMNIEYYHGDPWVEKID